MCVSRVDEEFVPEQEGLAWEESEQYSEEGKCSLTQLPFYINNLLPAYFWQQPKDD